ncbi:MAG TPA: hypothetical protein VLE93_01245 [Candidatus Saccharimonadales bacterium]|nr:hypothetical protein [Candidatus Saccharimonadales bacterium]
MFELLAIGSVVVMGLIATTMSKIGSQKKRISALESEKRRQEELAASLYGITGGVWIRRPDGNAHPIQNLLEQELSARGMALFNLRREPAENLIKNGEWDSMIAVKHLDVAILGKLITHQITTDRVHYISVQHVHTKTGVRFHELGKNHSDYRMPNSIWLDDYEAASLDPDDEEENLYYFEHDEHFALRKEKEKIVEPISTEQYTVDVRFYGSDGSVRGGYIGTKIKDIDSEPTQTLTAELVTAVSKSVKRSLLAHENSTSRFELDGK